MSSRPLFTSSDAWLAGGFIAAAVAVAPADKFFTRQLQDDARQANRYYRGSATVGRIWGFPGAFVAGAGFYAFGTANGNRRIQDLGLHTMESVAIANSFAGALKLITGRARPYVDSSNAGDFKVLRGFRNGDYRSFPSGHSTGAFAFAAIVTAETSHWWPGGKWIVGSASYGMAALSGISRIYNYEHWATDVIAGGAIGTLVGLKVFRYQHSHPGNKLDNTFLKAGMQSSGGRWTLLLSASR